MAGVALAHQIPITLDNEWLDFALRSRTAYSRVGFRSPFIWQSIWLHDDVSIGVILIALPHGPKTVTTKTLVRAGTEVYPLLDRLAREVAWLAEFRLLPLRRCLSSVLYCWLLMRKCNSSVGSWKRSKGDRILQTSHRASNARH